VAGPTNYTKISDAARGRSEPAGSRVPRWAHHRPEERTVSVEQRVIDIVSEHFAYDKEKITRNTTFIEDIGADSLDIVEFVMELEEEFDIQIPDDQAEKIKTVGEAVEYIDNAIKNKPQ
jgi:acyl carrier protein